MNNYKNNKSEKKSVVEAASDISMLPIDTLCGFPYIQIHGQRELSVEGHCTISGYDAGHIYVVCGKNTLCISGQDLEIKFMDKDALVVGGYISSLVFERK